MDTQDVCGLFQVHRVPQNNSSDDKIQAELVLPLGGRTDKLLLVDAPWRILEQYGRSLIKDGQTLHHREESLPEIESHVASFLEGKYALWKALGVV